MYQKRHRLQSSGWAAYQRITEHFLDTCTSFYLYVKSRCGVHNNHVWKG